MVHRKSEYRLNYKWLPSELCRDIRLSTADFRVERKKSDLAHFWSWDINGVEADGGKCECEDEDEAEKYLPVPRMKQKHDHLLEQYQKSQFTSPRRNIPLHSPYKPASPPALAYESMKSHDLAQNAETHTPTWVLEDATRRMPTPRDVEPTANNYIPEVNPVTHQPMDDQLNTTRRKYSATYEDRPIQRSYNTGAGVTTSYAVPGPLFHRVQSAGTRRPILRSSLQPAIRPSSAIAYTSNTPQNRSRSKKMDIQSSKPPFVSYGWNDNCNTIGDQKTFNVKATKSREVYPSALKAYKRKEADVKRQIVAEQQRNLLSKYETFRCPGHPVNPSSIWMTEYRRNYNNASRG